MAYRCANMTATSILYLRKEAVLRKKHVINGPVCRDRQAGPRSHTRGQGTGLPPPVGVRSPAAWKCSISVWVNGLCLTFNVIELAHHLK